MSAAERKAFSWERCPRSIRIFIFAYISCVLFGAMNSYFQFEFIRVRIMEMSRTGDLPRDILVYAMILFRAFVALAILAWVLLRYSLIGRLLIGLQLVGWIYGTPTAIGFLAEGSIKALPFLLAGLSSALAVACLMVNSSRLWFARKGVTLADDLDSFS